MKTTPIFWARVTILEGELAIVSERNWCTARSLPSGIDDFGRKKRPVSLAISRFVSAVWSRRFRLSHDTIGTIYPVHACVPSRWWVRSRSNRSRPDHDLSAGCNGTSYLRLPASPTIGQKSLPLKPTLSALDSPKSNIWKKREYKTENETEWEPKWNRNVTEKKKRKTEKNEKTGTIVNRTYGMHKNLPGIYLTILLTIFGPINYGPP